MGKWAREHLLLINKNLIMKNIKQISTSIILLLMLNWGGIPKVFKI